MTSGLLTLKVTIPLQAWAGHLYQPSSARLGHSLDSGKAPVLTVPPCQQLQQQARQQAPQQLKLTVAAHPSQLVRYSLIMSRGCRLHVVVLRFCTHLADLNAFLSLVHSLKSVSSGTA